jgi:hypothetical protein
MKPLKVIPAMRDWYEQHIAEPRRMERRISLQAEPSLKVPPMRTPATADDLLAIKAIGGVTYCPGIGTKRFARDIQGATELTAAQRLYLWQVVWRYRRQIHDQRLVSLAEGGAPCR